MSIVTIHNPHCKALVSDAYISSDLVFSAIFFVNFVSSFYPHTTWMHWASTILISLIKSKMKWNYEQWPLTTDHQAFRTSYGNFIRFYFFSILIQSNVNAAQYQHYQVFKYFVRAFFLFFFFFQKSIYAFCVEKFVFIAFWCFHITKYLLKNNFHFDLRCRRRWFFLMKWKKKNNNHNK